MVDERIMKKNEKMRVNIKAHRYMYVYTYIYMHNLNEEVCFIKKKRNDINKSTACSIYLLKYSFQFQKHRFY